MSAIIAGMVAVATVAFLTALAHWASLERGRRPAPPEEPRVEPNHRNRVVSMIMEAAAVMRRCEGLLVRRFDRDTRVLVLETPAQR